jgi:hypothetical protein
MNRPTYENREQREWRSWIHFSVAPWDTDSGSVVVLSASGLQLILGASRGDAWRV